MTNGRMLNVTRVPMPRPTCALQAEVALNLNLARLPHQR